MPSARACRPAWPGVVPGIVLLALALALAGCAKRELPGYGPGQAPAAPAAAPAPLDPATLPQGWGYVDVICREGVNQGRGVPDTLFGCLLHARESGIGTVILPRGVYLGHAAQFIVAALKYYHVESNFQELYGCRVVLLFRPASQEELRGRDLDGAERLGLGVAGEVVLTVGAGAPLVPIIAPLAFAFESVREDLRYQEYRKDAVRQGLPEPTRRGDEIVAQEYARRYEGYWNAVTGSPAPETEQTTALYVVERCFLQPTGRPTLWIASWRH